MDEQPVALAMMARSPNSCVMSLTYGVSPQPAQAPGVLEQRLQQLVGLDAVQAHQPSVILGQVEEEFVVLPFLRPESESAAPC